MKPTPRSPSGFSLPPRPRSAPPATPPPLSSSPSASPIPELKLPDPALPALPTIEESGEYTTARKPTVQEECKRAWERISSSRYPFSEKEMKGLEKVFCADCRLYRHTVPATKSLEECPLTHGVHHWRNFKGVIIASKDDLNFRDKTYLILSNSQLKVKTVLAPLIFDENWVETENWIIFLRYMRRLYKYNEILTSSTSLELVEHGIPLYKILENVSTFLTLRQDTFRADTSAKTRIKVIYLLSLGYLRKLCDQLKIFSSIHPDYSKFRHLGKCFRNIYKFLLYLHEFPTEKNISHYQNGKIVLGLYDDLKKETSWIARYFLKTLQEMFPVVKTDTLEDLAPTDI